MASLDRIEIEGFKSIRKLDLELKPLNVLIGANGAGKTNFISVFKLLNQIVEQNLQVFVGKSGGADTLLYFGQKLTSDIFFRLTFGNAGYIARLIPAAGDTLFFGEERCRLYDENDLSESHVHMERGHSETRLHIEYTDETKVFNRVKRTVVDALQSWRVYHFHDTSESAKVKLTGDIDDNLFLRPDAANLAAFLYLLRGTKRDYYERIVNTIRLVAPFFDDFVLTPSRLRQDKIQLEWRHKGSDSYFNAHSLSDGTLRFICLATLLLQPELPSTILIDEPELGLHPAAITVLASLLQSASTKTQVIFTTQSVTLMDHFSQDNIIVVEHENGESVFRPLSGESLDDWLEDYTIGELWEKNVIGGRP